MVTVAAVFLVSSIFGYVAPVQQKEGFAREMSRIITPIRGLPSPVLLVVIFLNNALKALLAIILGFLFGIVPLVFAAGNGYLLGLLISLSHSRMGLGDIAMRILPHGIIEIPTFLAAGGFGLWLGVKFLGKIRRGTAFRPFLAAALHWFIRCLVPLILLAALVETFITPYLAGINP